MDAYTEQVKEAALSYAARGWAVLPLRPGGKEPATAHGVKDATTDPKIITSWYDRHPGRGVAIAAGLRSGLVVVDLDEKEAYTDESGRYHSAVHGLEEFAAWEKSHGKIAEGPRVRTGRGGLHLYLEADDDYRNGVGVLPGVDIRSSGGYVVAPPTLHPNGTPYTWEITPDEQEPPPVSGSIRQLLRQAREKDIDADLYKSPEEILEGSRVDNMIKLAGYLVGIGLDREAIKAAIRSENDAKCSPPLNDWELEHEVFPALSRNWEKGKSYQEATPREVSPLPDFSRPLILPEELPQLRPALIDGVLRQGHKMQISAPSKAGKSFLLIELATAIATGKNWLGMPCKPGKVLYINLEIDAASFDNRVYKVCTAAGYDLATVAENLTLWHLRGHAMQLDELLEPLRQRVKSLGVELEAIIIDPVYKLGLGDENSAEAVGGFCNQVDKLSEATGAAVIYAHHHSKGAQGRKSSMDRASGSGVFARDPDAILSMSPLVGKLDKDDTEKSEEELQAEDEVYIMDRKPYRLTFTLREFPEHRPIDVFFDYPLHTTDGAEVLRALPEEGSREGNLAASSKRISKSDKLPEAFEYLLAHPDKSYKGKEAKTPEGCVKIQALAAYLGVARSTVYSWITKKYAGEYETVDGGYCQKKQDICQ